LDGTVLLGDILAANAASPFAIFSQHAIFFSAAGCGVGAAAGVTGGVGDTAKAIEAMMMLMGLLRSSLND
jgi:hypothetical protein